MDAQSVTYFKNEVVERRENDGSWTAASTAKKNKWFLLSLLSVAVHLTFPSLILLPMICFLCWMMSIRVSHSSKSLPSWRDAFTWEAHIKTVLDKQRDWWMAVMAVVGCMISAPHKWRLDSGTGGHFHPSAGTSCLRANTWGRWALFSHFASCSLQRWVTSKISTGLWQWHSYNHNLLWLKKHDPIYFTLGNLNVISITK